MVEPHTHLKSQNPLMQSVADLTMINCGVQDYLLQRALHCRPQIIAPGDNEEDFLYCMIVLGGIPVHTEYRCLFFLRYEFLKYRNTGVI